MRATGQDAQKIAYVAIIFDLDNMNGVLNKLRALAPSFSNSGFQVIVINDAINADEGNIKFITFDSLFTVPSIFRRLFVRSFKYLYVTRAIRLGGHRVAVVRYSFADFSLPFLLLSRDVDVFLEHHTKEPAEILAMLRFRSIKFLQLFFEYIFPKIFGHLAKGTIGVSKDITAFAAKRFSTKRAITIGNRVSDDIFVKERTNLEVSKCLNVVMSASRFSDWHGLDQLLDALERYRGGVRVNLHLVGELDKKTRVRVDACISCNVNIFCHGKLPQKHLFEIYNNSHVGVDSLGLARIGITHGSTLKSKEYMARCLPFVFSTPDEAFAGYPAFHAEGGTLDIQSMVDWCVSLQGQTIRSSAFRLQLSWESAAAQLSEFVSFTKAS